MVFLYYDTFYALIMIYLITKPKISLKYSQVLMKKEEFHIIKINCKKE